MNDNELKQMLCEHYNLQATEVWVDASCNIQKFGWQVRLCIGNQTIAWVKYVAGKHRVEIVSHVMSARTAPILEAAWDIVGSGVLE